MTVYLKDIHDFQQLEHFESVLIAPCRFCPAASLTVRNNEPYFKFFWHLLQTDAYERYIRTMKSELEKKGVFEHEYEKAVTSGITPAEIKRASEIAGLVKNGAHSALSNCIDELVGSQDTNSITCGKTAPGSCCC